MYLKLKGNPCYTPTSLYHTYRPPIAYSTSWPIYLTLFSAIPLLAYHGQTKEFLYTLIHFSSKIAHSTVKPPLFQCAPLLSKISQFVYIATFGFVPLTTTVHTNLPLLLFRIIIAIPHSRYLLPAILLIKNTVMH